MPKKPPARMLYPPVDYDIEDTASAMGTTGMMPVLPGTLEEYASYQELAGMGIPNVRPNDPASIVTEPEPDEETEEPEWKK